MAGTPGRNIDKITGSLEGTKSIETIIRENPNANIDEEQYREFLTVRLNTEQENLFLRKELTRESIEEISRHEIDMLQAGQYRLENQQERQNNILTIQGEGDLESSNTREEAENLLSSMEEVEREVENADLTSEEKEKAGVLSRVKDKASEVAAGGAIDGWIGSLEKVRDSGGFLGILATIALFFLNGLRGLMGIFEKKEKVEEALDPKKIEETKKAINQVIEEKYGKELTQVNRENIKKTLDGLTEEQLIALYESYKAGKLNLKVINEIIPGIVKDILSPEQIEKAKEFIIKKFTDSLKENIQKTYGITINNDSKKLKELETLVRQNVNLNDSNILVFKDVVERKSFVYSDFLGPLGEVAINIGTILLGLLSKGIVPVGAVAAEVAYKGADVITLSARAMVGFTGKLNFEEFGKYVEGLGEKERLVAIGLLYRKGGLFLSILGNLSAAITSVGVGIFNKTSLGKFEAWGASLTGNLDKQIKNFEKLTKTLNAYDKDAAGLLKQAIKNVNSLKNNTLAMKAIEEAALRSDLIDDTAKMKYVTKELKKIKGFPKIDVEDFNNFKSFVIEVGKNFPKYSTFGISSGALKSNLLFGIEADLFKFNQKIEQISKAQRYVIGNNLGTKSWGRLKEFINIGEIGRLGDRLTLHFSSAAGAKEGISKLNALAKNSPQLIKGFFDKLPIITVAGFAAASDEPFFEELKKESRYLVPILGPMTILLDSGWDWSGEYPIPKNPENVGIGMALLGIDGVILGKTITKGIAAGNLPSSLAKYFMKPLADIYGLARGTGEVIYSIGKGARIDKVAISLIQKAIARVKNMPGDKKVKAVALLAVIGYIGINEFFSDDKLSEIFTENGLDYQSIKTNAENLSDKEKEQCLKSVLEATGDIENLVGVSFQVKNNVLYITSRNKNIKNDWFMYGNDFNLYTDLKLNPPKDSDFIDFTENT